MKPNVIRSPRDRRIDFWRGLCLIDMVLVHLYYGKIQFGILLGPFLGEYTRFAAGGFILVAGLAIGAIFLPKARDPLQRRKTYFRLWRRSLRVLAWQYFVAVTWVGLGIYRNSHAPITSIGKLARDIVWFREGGDLLPLYVILIAASPLMLEVGRRKGGRLALAALSIGLFCVGRVHPYALAFDPEGNFPPPLWQIIFVAGLLSGSLLTQYDALSPRTKLWMAGLAWMGVVLLFWAEFWWQYQFLPRCPIELGFAKVPLGTGEMLRYLCIVSGILISTDLLWPRISNTRGAAFAATMGRSTLPVYVFHLYLMELASYVATNYWWWIGAWQLVYIPICLALLWGLALLLQWPNRKTTSATDWSIWFGREVASASGK
jgi:hypothetical protein